MELPILVGGMYFGYNLDDFLQHVGRELPDKISYAPARINRCILNVIARYTNISDSVKRRLWRTIRVNWH